MCFRYGQALFILVTRDHVIVSPAGRQMTLMGSMCYGLYTKMRKEEIAVRASICDEEFQQNDGRRKGEAPSQEHRTHSRNTGPITGTLDPSQENRTHHRNIGPIPGTYCPSQEHRTHHRTRTH